eukprot:GEMP01056329.1.p1 GENE.GEMP01056329.1~~GEMP01056329.1.p1  ORF type:complete len:213 (+),score=54.13 GEMP01056329.1:63-701(+)
MDRDPLSLESRNDALEASVSRFEAQERVRLELEGVQTQRMSRNLVEETFTGTTRDMEYQLNLDIKVLRDTRKEHELKCSQLLERHTDTIRECIFEERRRCESEQGRQTRFIGDDIYKLYNDIEVTRTHRLDHAENITMQLEDEFNTLRDAIDVEKKARANSESHLLRSLEDLCSRLQKEVREERLQRDECTGRLVLLLEDTCSHVERASLEG